jgi:hypothetical protein
MDLSHPSNRKIIAFLTKRNPEAALSLLPGESPRDPYLHLGSHPDIVERIWKGIGVELPSDCRMIVCGDPVLVQPQSGIILAITLGTQYCLHLPADVIAGALAAGAKTTTKWSSGTVMDVAREFGPDWIFGNWSKAEIGWCQQAYQIFGSVPDLRGL